MNANYPHTQKVKLMNLIMQNPVDTEYVDLINTVLRSGRDVHTRNSRCVRVICDTRVFSTNPMISVRRMGWQNALREMEWFLSGSNRLEDLHPDTRKWWEPWNINGYVPFNYGLQLRQFKGYAGIVDQVSELIRGIKHHPYSRRNVITTWNTSDMLHASKDKRGITNCHGTVIQAFVDPETNQLSLFMYQRSADLIVGVPHNWFQYWAMLIWLSHQCNRNVGELYWTGGDVHIYSEHMDLAKKIAETPLDSINTPRLVYTPRSEEFRAEDFTLSDPYRYILPDSAPMIV